MKKPLPPFIDAFSLAEDERCRVIGEQAASGKVVAFIVEDNEKADRYMRKVRALFPAVVELHRFAGPVADTIAVKVGLPEREN